MAVNVEPSSAIPLKLYFPSRKVQIGIAAKSLRHLREIIGRKFGVTGNFNLVLEDGTIVCDPEYFNLLAHQTKLTVLETPLKLGGRTTATVDVVSRPDDDGSRKRPSTTVPPAPAKQAKLSAPETTQAQEALNTNQNNSQLLSNICITSVQGEVSMSSRSSAPEKCTIPPPAADEAPAKQQLKPSKARRPTTGILGPTPMHQMSTGLPNFRPSLAGQPIPMPQQRNLTIPPKQSFMYAGAPPSQFLMWPFPVGEQCRPTFYHNQVCPPGPRENFYPQRHMRLPRPPVQYSREQIYQMQVEQQMRTSIRMSPPPQPLSHPPQPVHLAQPVPTAVHQSRPPPQPVPTAVHQSRPPQCMRQSQPSVVQHLPLPSPTQQTAVPVPTQLLQPPHNPIQSPLSPIGQPPLPLQARTDTGQQLVSSAVQMKSPPTSLQLQSAPGLPQSTPALPQSTPTLIQSTPALIQSTPGFIQSAPGLPQSAPGLIQSAPGLPQSAPGLPQSAPGLIQSAPGLPRSPPALPQSAPGLPRSPPALPQSAPGLPRSPPALPRSPTMLSPVLLPIQVRQHQIMQAQPTAVQPLPSQTAQPVPQPSPTAQPVLLPSQPVPQPNLLQQLSPPTPEWHAIASLVRPSLTAAPPSLQTPLVHVSPVPHPAGVQVFFPPPPPPPPTPSQQRPLPISILPNPYLASPSTAPSEKVCPPKRAPPMLLKVTSSEESDIANLRPDGGDDSDDEPALRIVESEESVLQPGPASPSPHEQSASPKPLSPEVASLKEHKRYKPSALNLSQLDDGYCSAATSSLGSADDVKTALPFANFVEEDFIPLSSCCCEEEEDCENQETEGFSQSSPVFQDHYTEDEKQAGGVVTLDEEARSLGVECSNDEDCCKSLVVSLPIRVIDGQIYYHQISDKITVKSEQYIKPTKDVARSEVILIDLESEDQDSDVDTMKKHILNYSKQITSRSKEFSLSLEDEESEVDCSDTDNQLNTSSASIVTDYVHEELVVADHCGEVPVVTTPPLHIDMDQCVADIIRVMKQADFEQTYESSTACANPSCLSTVCKSTDTPLLASSETTVEECVLLDSSSLQEFDEELPEQVELAMGNEVILSMEGSSQSYDYLDSSELLSSLLLHSCLPEKGRHISLS